MARNTLAIVIPEMTHNKMQFDVVGRTGLIIKRFGEKDLHDIEAKQQGLATPKREARKPKEECERARLKNDKGQDCVRTIWFKKAMAAMGGYFGLPRGTIEQGVYIDGDLVPIKFSGKQPIMRSDRVNLSQGMVKKTSIAYRPEFPGWSCKLTVFFDSTVITPQQIVALLAHAGMKNGIGEWRPQKGGDFGRFDVLPDGASKKLLSSRPQPVLPSKSARADLAERTGRAGRPRRAVTTAADMVGAVANKTVRRPRRQG